MKTVMVLLIFSFMFIGCPGQRDGSDDNIGLSGRVSQLVVEPPEYQGSVELAEEERLKAELAEEERLNAQQDPDCSGELNSSGEYEFKCLFEVEN